MGPLKNFDGSDIPKFSLEQNKQQPWNRECSGRVVDFRPSGRWFEPHQCHCVVVLEQGTFVLA